MKTKRIMILCKSINAGTGTYTGNLLKLSESKYKKSFELKLFALERPKYKTVKIAKDQLFANGNYYPESYSLSFRNINKFGKEMVFLKRKIDIFEPEIIMTVDSYCLILLGASRLLWNLKTKTISSIHNNLNAVIQAKIPFPLRSLVKYAIGVLLSRSDKVVCVSEKLAADLQQTFHLRRKPLHIYHGVKLIKKTKPHQYKKSEQKIITIARFSKQKDFKTLFSSFSVVTDSFPDAKLLVIGDGPEKKNILRLIRHYKLGRNVQLKGWLQDPGVLLNKSDIFVLSSNWEGFGYVLLEALANGLPVVSTDTPYGPEEILGEGRYGVLVPPGNPQKLALAIKRLLASKKNYDKYANLGLKRSKDFPINSMLIRYRYLFESL